MFRRDVLKVATAAAGMTLLCGASSATATEPAKRKSRQTRRKPWIDTRDGARLFCRDWGSGDPMVFLSGWSLPSENWSYVMARVCESGVRCVAYDRRGHGRSSDPGGGYDYDTLADDLSEVLNALDLQHVTLIAHSMSGGEAIRYLSRRGASRIARLVLIGTTLPFLTKTADNADGIDPSLFGKLREAMLRDYPKWLLDNSPAFFTPETSTQLMDWGRSLMLQASMQAVIECSRTMTTTDFRAELPRVSVPTLVIHGDKDASAPLALCGARAAKLIPNAELRVYSGPHGLPLTHAPQLAKDLLEFAQT